MSVKVSNTRHVMERIAERVPDAQEQDTLYRDMLKYAAMLSGEGVHSVAVRFARLGFHGTRWQRGGPDTGSNGDCAVFVMRDDTIVTFMWRRASQPHFPAKYDTAHTRCVKYACTGVGPSHVHA